MDAITTAGQTAAAEVETPKFRLTHQEIFSYDPKPTGKMTGIELYYYKDGRQGRGVYLSMNPVELKDDHRLISLSGNGVLTLVYPMPRKNDKLVAAVVQKIEPIAAELIRLYEAGDKPGLIVAALAAVKA
jgi:hypothetical protein